MNFLNVFKHLKPRATAFSLTVDKQLRQFFDGLAGGPEDAHEFLDLAWLDNFPQTTRELENWEQQFALPSGLLTEQERRDRLDATWKAVGGQSPRYIQDTLQGAGFDVYVHEWWVPGTEPAVNVASCATPRNPFLVLRSEFTGSDGLIGCGEPLAECGEAFAECGETVVPIGYPLVNKVLVSSPDIVVVCGNPEAEAGEPNAECGNYVDFAENFVNYVVPNDTTKWPYILYIGGQTFGDAAQVDSNRRDEFEDLCLKICPAQQWLGIIVNYN